MKTEHINKARVLSVDDVLEMLTYEARTDSLNMNASHIMAYIDRVDTEYSVEFFEKTKNGSNDCGYGKSIWAL